MGGGAFKPAESENVMNDVEPGIMESVSDLTFGKGTVSKAYEVPMRKLPEKREGPSRSKKCAPKCSKPMR